MTSERPAVVLVAALLALAASVRDAPAILLNDGGAPPDPAHVIDGDDPPGALWQVFNVGCDALYCPQAGAATAAELAAGGAADSISVSQSSAVNITGGTARLVESFWDAAIHMTGGAVAQLTGRAAIDGGDVDLFWGSDLHASGGFVREATIRGAAVIDGATIGDALTLQANSGARTTLVAGSVGSVRVHEYTRLDVTGGRVEGAVLADGAVGVSGGTLAGPLLMDQGGEASIAGGALAQGVAATRGATVSITGGAIETEISAATGATIALVGSGFAVDGVPVAHGPLVATSGVLSGTLVAGDTLAVPFTRDAGSTIVLEALPIVIDDGGAPPNPANVLDAADDVSYHQVVVRDAGCGAPDPFAPICPTAGTPTAVETQGAVAIGRDVFVYDASSLRLGAGASVAGDAFVHGTASFAIDGAAIGGRVTADGETSVVGTGGSAGDVTLRGNATLSWTGGQIADRLELHDAARATLTGGRLGGHSEISDTTRLLLDGVADASVIAYVGASVTVASGTVAGVGGWDGGRAFVYGGEVGQVTAWREGRAAIEGGRVANVRTNGGHLAIRGGEVFNVGTSAGTLVLTAGRVTHLYPGDALVDVSGGEIFGGSGRPFATLQINGWGRSFLRGGAVHGDLVVHGSPLYPSVLVWTGGAVEGPIRAGNDGTIEIRGRDFAVDGVAVGYGPVAATSGVLTGTFASGQPIDVAFTRPDPYPTSARGAIVLPEPGAASLACAAVTALALARRRISAA